VQAVEILPGDPTVVHHAVMRVDFTGSVRRLDEADPAPGFDGMVFGGARMPDGRFIGWTPGRQPDPGDPDRAWRLLPGSDLVLQLHLRPSGKPEPIAAKVGLHLAEHPPRRAALAIELSSTRIDLPAGAKGVTVEDRYQLPIDAAIRSVYPHAHYLGTKVEGWAELPDGSKKWLVKIDDWDFDWQDEYRYRRAVSLPAGSTLHMAWTFDNSADNPHNPSSPPVDVHYGQSSTDEMAELIIEVEPTDPREIAALDRDFQRKWLRDQAATIERMLAANPDDVDRIADLAALRQLAGDTDAAIETYQRALQADAGHARSLHELGIAYLARKQVDEAIAVLRRAVAAAPEDAGPHLVLANALRKSGDDVAAIAEYRRALALDDANANAHNNLGIVLEARGDHEGAITHFTRATELVPTQALFQRNLARAQTKTK
jgi:Flp pilus assembly protein TadD